MEEVTNETGHRPSVSMPSLDTSDDFPSQTLTVDNTDAVFTTTEPYGSATSTDTVVASDSSEIRTMHVNATDIAEDTAPSTSELSTVSLLEASESSILTGPTFTPDPDSQPFESTSGLIEAGADQQPILDAPSEGFDDSQVDEDPSAAIDQFIQKIADEQLSSKRMEERKEEEAQEKMEQTVNSEDDTEDLNTSVSSNTVGPTPIDDNFTKPDEDKSPVALDKPAEEENYDLDASRNQTEENAEPEPMEVVSGIAVEQKKTLLSITPKMEDGDDHMMAESIEEIQKEIDKMPAKKNSKTEPVESTGLNARSHNSHKMVMKAEEESIEDILGGGDVNQNKSSAVLDPPHKGPTIEDSADVAKNANLIEKSQEEIKKLDVLVCGQCHNTFYYIQDFSDHKKAKCSQTSAVTSICESEGKPQVWGFILWKTKHAKEERDAASSWLMYQRWCKLPQSDKNAWITAGQSIQFASKIGNSRVTEVRPAKPAKQTTVQRITDTTPPPLEFVDSNKENSSNMDASNIIKKGITKPVKLNNDVTITPSSKSASTNDLSNSNTAIRTTKIVSTQKDEFVVEKIIAKRFNPRKKTWEYNIKWENFSHESNTWEPVSNLSHCKKLLEQFEEQLKRMKEEKAKQVQTTPKGRGRPAKVPKSPPHTAVSPKISNVVGGVADDYGSTSSNRPQRSSKQKAMNQVKQWCGSISDEEGDYDLKRKYETDDSDEDYDDKRIKLEEDSDDSSREVRHRMGVKKISTAKSQTPAKVTVKNGNNSQQILPSNILIPDANGVVRINQKQLPALSSGVYIMSKTAGIIKLDSTSSKVATSGGQTIVKVAPKIGQTQIKIVKKDGNTTKQIIQVSPKTITSTPLKMPTSGKLQSRDIKRTSSSDSKLASKLFLSSKEPEDSESDDGLEPLPFPNPDDPLPELEDEVEDENFVLDPETGKLAGVDYVDKPVVIKEEPTPSATKSELENIVKIATAGLSDDELQNSDSQDSALFDVKQTVKQPIIKSEPSIVQASSGHPLRKVVKYAVSGGRTESSSILNKTLLQGAQKQVVSQSVKVSPQMQQRRVVQQKVINQMISQRTPGSQGRTVVRHVIEPSRPGHGSNVNVIRKTITSSAKSKFNLTPQKPLPSPLQPTRTYSAMGGIRQTNVGGPGSKVQVYSAKSNVAASQTAAQGGARRVANTVVRSAGNQGVAAQRQHAYAAQKQPVTRIVQRVVSTPKKPGQVNSSVAQVQAKPASPVKPRTVISMPSLTEEDSPLSPTKAQQKQQAAQAKAAPAKMAAPAPAAQIQMKQEAAEQAAAEAAEAATTDQTDWSSFTMADGDNPIYVTGDDGTIYQVAGQNEQGQTILITQGPDGQQQCLLVTNDIAEMTGEDQQQGASGAEATPAEEVTQATGVVLAQSEDGTLEIPVAADPELAQQASIQTPLQINTDTEMMECIEDGDGIQDQVVAQVVRAEPPSPGGTHKVVVMLPDGNLMVTQVSPEEYASLELE
ncbi:uncharacterized protein LOC109540159 isoform X1 [Dendroctonus ponderosae]|uniref:uncharacterized protein LOC109540159 isoform X1 n=1 Tax=Dendroctonus ponderosae TaxID=77166 RepID=UPI00203591A9|nr:uncharacterized protein LOC109540159 isoform X1 [Dendroctonus ponderosae]XP_048524137.1 uncharacterized protein LOC109540159 isoform X1 [Dendroctonus ponderosae]